MLREFLFSEQKSEQQAQAADFRFSEQNCEITEVLRKNDLAFEVI
jgi:hypothetical protein